MKKVLFFIAALILASATVNAQADLEVFARVGDNSAISGADANIFLAQPLSRDTTCFLSKLKVASFTLMEQGWGEQLFGLAWSPRPWCEIGLMAGVEQNPALGRICASIWLGGAKDSFVFLYEKGEGTENWWYRTAYKHQCGNFIIGAQSWRFQVTGPFVGYKVSPNLTIWANPGRNFEDGWNAVVVGLGVKFL